VSRRKRQEKRELEKRFREFDSPPRRLRFPILDAATRGEDVILTMRFPRALDADEVSTCGSLIKARLTTDLPRAAAACRVIELVRDFHTYRYITAEGRSFAEPSWFLRSPYTGQLGPVGFNIDWDSRESRYYARLGPMVISLNKKAEVIERWTPIMAAIGRGYVEKVRTVSI
jgi:hypothetical protein